MNRWVSWAVLAALPCGTLFTGCAEEFAGNPSDESGGGTEGSEGGAGGSIIGSSSIGGAGASPDGGTAGMHTGDTSNAGGAGASPDGGTAGMHTGGTSNAGGAQSASSGGAGGSGGDCGDNPVYCDGECVDPESDLEHCGASADCLGDNAGTRCQTSHSCHEGRCISWEAPVRLTVKAVPRSFPLDIAMNENGVAVLAWSQHVSEEIEENDNARVFATLYTPDTGWAIPEWSAYGRSRPCVTVDGEGTAVLAWRSEPDIEDYNLLFVRHGAGSGWGAVGIVAENSPAGYKDPRACELGMDATGTPRVVWTTNTPDGLWSTSFTEDQTWRDPVALEEGSDDYSDASLALHASGAAIAIWARTMADQQSIRVAHLEPNSDSATVEEIARLTARSGDPDVVIDPQGNAIAIWGDQVEDEGAVLRASRFTPGGGWGEVESLDLVLPQSSPRIGMDAAGNAVVAWYSDDTVWANHYSVESGWGTTERIGDILGGPWLWDRPDSYDLQLAVSSAGDAVAVWPQVISVPRSEGESSDAWLWSSRYTPGLGWGEPEVIDVTFASLYISFDVAIDGQGNAMVAWSARENGLGDLWASRSSRPE